MFQALFGGDIPQRLQKAGVLVAVTGVMFFAGALVMEGLFWWNEPMAMVGLYALTGLTLLAALLYHYLRLTLAISRWRYVRTMLLDTLLLVAIVATAAQPEAMTLIATFKLFVLGGRVFVFTGYGRRFTNSLQRNPAKLVALSFAFMIAIGTVMLTFPRATTDGQGAPVVDALFTATSANCVTGLVVLNTNEDSTSDPRLKSFSLFGQIVILLLIQFGGLGIMTLSTSAVLLLGGRLSFRSRRLMSNVLDEDGIQSVAGMIRYIVGMTLTFELIGTAILTWRFQSVFPGDLGMAAWYGLFHAVSAFCNAGFSLFGNNLAGFVTDPTINLTIALLIIFGGLGFPVIAALFSRRTWKLGIHGAWRRFPIQTKLVLFTTAVLIFGGMGLLLVLDAGGGMKDFALDERLWASFFHSVSARTAGFNTIDLGNTSRAAVLFYVLLMFVGASPGGTGGGIKTTSLALVILSIRATLTGRMDVEVGSRSIPRRTVYKAMAITAVSAFLCIIVCLVLLATQADLSTEQILFEVTSAFGTVGLSMNASTHLDVLGRLVITMLMYIGRIGPLTLTLALGQQTVSGEGRYPEGRVVVG